MRRKVGPRFVKITPEQLPDGSFVRLYSAMIDGYEVVTNALFEGNVRPAYTPTPTPIPPPTPTPTPPPPLRPVLPSLQGYSTLLAEAASNLPPQYDFVSDGLTAEEREILDWADSRLFANPNFMSSKWGPDNWPLDGGGRGSQLRGSGQNRLTNEADPSRAQVRLASTQGIILMMLEIDVQTKPDGKHVIAWEKDSLDRILDGLNVFTGRCVYCYGKTGFDTRQGLIENFVPIVDKGRHRHREMLKTFAYFAKADGEGILIRGFRENDADDFEMLHTRGLEPSTTARRGQPEQIDIMTQIRLTEAMPSLELPAGALVSYPTMAFGIVGNATTEREAVERVFDYIRFRSKHWTGDHEDFRNIYAPYSATPYSPELGWRLYVGELGSGTASELIAGTLRALGIKAQEMSERGGRFYITGSVEIDGEMFYHNGNGFLGSGRGDTEVCTYFLEEEFYGPETEGEKFSPLDQSGNESCQILLEKKSSGRPFVSDRPSPDREALISLFEATDGPNWTRNDHWLSDRPVEEWYGVTTHEGRVTHLHLYFNNLSGEFPPEIGDLHFLRELHLSFNNLQGPVPPALGDLEFLEKLYLGGMQYLGALSFDRARRITVRQSITEHLEKLDRLVHLSLRGTSLEGCVPKFLKEQLYPRHSSHNVRPGIPFCGR